MDTSHDNLYEQKKYLLKQIIIANELKLPVIIHASNTNSLVIEIFEKYVKPKYGCVFHCFQPDLNILKYLVEHGYYISFVGQVSYKNAKKSIKVAQVIPDELFLVETDSLYISPEPLRNEINKSANIQFIINRLAEVKNKSYSEIEEATTQNTKRLFKRMK